MEDHILNTGNGLATRSYLDELWSMALLKIVNALRTHSVSIGKITSKQCCNNITKQVFFSQAYCTDATLILKIKNLIMLFNTTLSVSSLSHRKFLLNTINIFLLLFF